MNFQEQELGILEKLGLSSLQAKVYFALAGLQQDSVKNVSAVSQIDRAHVYQIINRLYEIGLVKRKIGVPNIYEAVPIQEGLQILLSRKAVEWSQIKRGADQIIKKNRKTETTNISADDKSQFKLVRGGELKIREFSSLIDRVKTSYDGIFLREEDYCAEAFRNHKIDSMWSLPLRRGARIRLIVGKSDNKNLPRKEVTRIIESLNKIGFLAVRFTSSHLPSTFGIANDNEIIFSVGSSIERRKRPSLISNNPQFVALAKGYFDHMWQISEVAK